MTLIINYEIDFTTDLICLWLNKYKKKYIRISNTKQLYSVYSDFSSTIQINVFGEEKIIDLYKLNSVFYKNSDLSYVIDPNNDIYIDSKMNKFLLQEWEILKGFIKYKIAENCKNLIGNINFNTVNKLNVLSIAKDIGFKVPYTNIISQKKVLNKVLRNKIKFITKPMSEVVLKITDNGNYMNYTRILKDNISISENFSPSLIQEFIEKKYEIRTYFIGKEFWSIAIFSQSQSQTQVDYRNYNNENLNRSEPFEIPNQLKIKIIKLAINLKLNSGSVDFIYSSKNKFYFLEINPIGQFSNVSSCGNFLIEKKIAKML